MRILATAVLLVSSPLWLVGCYDDVGTTMHEPHEYKGKKDPLLSKLKGKELQDDLSNRFKESQTDR